MDNLGPLNRILRYTNLSALVGDEVINFVEDQFLCLSDEVINFVEDQFLCLNPYS